MKLTAVFTTILISLNLVKGEKVRVSFDDIYDNPDGDVSTVACSDGVNGMLSQGFTTFGALQKQHSVGASSVIEKWDSDKCGSCWELTYNGKHGSTKSIVVMAIDHTDGGFNIGQNAMNELTNGAALALGHADVDAVEVPC